MIQLDLLRGLITGHTPDLTNINPDEEQFVKFQSLQLCQLVNVFIHSY